MSDQTTKDTIIEALAWRVRCLEKIVTENAARADCRISSARSLASDIVLINEDVQDANTNTELRAIIDRMLVIAREIEDV